MARDNAEWLRKTGLLARTVTIKVRYDDFTTITRSDTRPPTSDADEIVRRAVRAARQDRRRPAAGAAPRRGRPQLRRAGEKQDGGGRLFD